MKLMLATTVALLLFSSMPQITATNDDSGWSSPVNGLQARLSLARGQVFNGTPLMVTYLELRNVASVADVMEVPFNPKAIQFEVVDDRDKLLAPTPSPYDELDLGIPYVWVFSPGDKHSYYLRGRFSIEARKDRTWSGTIEMPRVKIPIAN